MAEQTIIKINVKDTIDQIADLSEKIEQLKKLQKQYKDELQQLNAAEVKDAKAIREKAKMLEASNRTLAQTTAARQHLRKEVDNAMKAETDGNNKLTLAYKMHVDAIQKGNAAYNTQVRSIAQAQEANRLMREAVRQLTDAEDESGEKRRQLNAMINQNTQYIKDHSDELVRQKMTVGDYKEQVKQAFAEMKNGGMTFKSLGIVSGQFAKILNNDFKSGWDAVTKGGNAFVGVLRLIKTAIAATGIGALILVLGSLVAMFTKTQKGVELFGKAMASVGAFVDVLIDRLSVFGDAVVKIFQGDFVGAANAAKQAVSGIGDELQRETKLAWELKAALNELEKQEVMLNMKISAGRAIIEEQKRIADDTTKSLNERIAAAKKAYDLEMSLSREAVEIGKKKLANMLGETELSEQANQLIKDMAAGAITADEAISKLGLSNSTVDDLKEFAALFGEVAQLEAGMNSRTKELQNKINQLRKEAIAAAQASRDAETAEIRKAEDELLKLVTDAREKQRKEVERSYDRQIEDLKTRLERETTLTVKAREAINQQIQELEAQKEADLQKLSDESLKKEIETAQKTIELKLAAVEAGTAKEYALKLEALQKQMEMELLNTELTEAQKLLVKEKYAKQVADLEKQQAAETAQRQAEEIKLRFENELAEMRLANTQKMGELMAMGATESQMRQQQYADDLGLLQKSHEQQLAERANMQQKQGETDEQFRARQLAADQKIAETENQMTQTKAQMFVGAYNDMKNAITQMGEVNSTFAKLSKVLALGEIAVQTGKALAAGIAQAQSVPFPGNLAAIATTVATILANIATATKTVKSAKFATGGTVTGPGTATSDSIPAMLSNGESVLTAAATSMFAPVLSVFNQIGGGVPIQATETANSVVGEEMLSRAFIKGAASLPSPVVSVVDINAGQTRVARVENLANL